MSFPSVWRGSNGIPMEIFRLVFHMYIDLIIVDLLI